MAVQRQLSSGPLTHSFSSLEHSPEGLALGDFLRQAREARGLTLQEISRTTKIPQRHLDALEHGNLTAIPGGPYRRGEIKAYAQVVGLDANVALARLDRAEHASPPPSPSAASPSVRRTELPARTLQRVAVVAGVASVIALAWVAASRGALDRAAAPRVALAPAVVPPAAAPTVAAPIAVAPASSPSDAPPATNTATTPVASSMPIEASAAPAADPDTLTPPRFDGELIITTDPPGARVTVNGIGWGRTPVTIPHIPFGEKRIRLTSDGHAAEEQAVVISEQQPTRELHVSLRPAQ